MQVSVEATSELNRKMTVHVPEEKILEQVSKRLKSMANKVRIDGFRPGKVPHGVIQKRFGPGVREEVLAEMIQSSFYDAVREENLKPVARPVIEPQAMEEGHGLKYVAHFEVAPEFVLFPLESMEVKRFVSEVNEEDVDAMLQRLREQRKTWRETDRPSASGDLAIVSFQGMIDGDSFTNGKVENVPVVLGASQMIPGFEERLLGLAAGATASFSLDFPEDYNVEKLAGKRADFEVEVHKVQEGVLPEIDAEFAQAFGVEDGDLNALREEIKTSMEREMKRALASRTKDAVLDELHKRNVGVELPKSMVDDELNQLVEPYRDSAKQQAKPFDEAEAKQRLAPVARRRVALGLLVNRIIELEQIKVSPERVRATIEELSLSYENPQQMANWYYSNQDQLNQVRGMVLEDQVVDAILARAQTTEERLAFGALMNWNAQTEAA
jgi:trigger factor